MVLQQSTASPAAEAGRSQENGQHGSNVGEASQTKAGLGASAAAGRTWVSRWTSQVHHVGRRRVRWLAGW